MSREKKVQIIDSLEQVFSQCNVCIFTDYRGTSATEMTDLRLAWLICKHTKSNAITICKDNMLIGNGAGQMSRVMSCRIATWLARDNGHTEKLAGSVAGSDAFFPFADGPNILMDAGVTALIQPGGSKRDGYSNCPPKRTDREQPCEDGNGAWQGAMKIRCQATTHLMPFLFRQ